MFDAETILILWKIIELLLIIMKNRDPGICSFFSRNLDIINKKKHFQE